MKSVFALACLISVVTLTNAGYAPLHLVPTSYVRSPQHDSAIVQSERLNGNFAYSTIEGHAFQAISPVVRNVIRPIGVSYQLNTLPLRTIPTQHFILQEPILGHLSNIQLQQHQQQQQQQQPQQAEENQSENLTNEQDVANAQDDDTVSVDTA